VTNPVLGQAEYERHRLRVDPAARESLSYMLQLPDEGIGGFVYTWVNGDSRGGAALCLYGPRIGAEPIFEIVDDVAVPLEQPFSDWRVGGLKLHHGEAFTSGVFTGRAATIDFTFEPTEQAYNYASHPDGGLPWMADDRYEQGGRWQGTLRLAESTVAFDEICHRDQSWGIRDWTMCQHYRWLQAHTGPETSVHFTEDLVIGTSSVRGYVNRDGHLAAIDTVDVEFELGADMFHTSLHAVVTDDAGRTTVVKGSTYGAVEFPVSPTTTLIVCSVTAEIDGVRGRGQFDLLWPSAYLAYVRERGLPQLPRKRGAD
jgi:hypothetical protein